MAELNQIKYPDITNGLAAYAKFYDVGQKMQERNAMAEAGGLYAGGDKQGAVNALAQAGQLGEATALEKSLRDATRQADADKLAKAQRFNQVLGNLVMTVKGLPPEKQPAAWNTAIDSAKGAGLDVEKYRDPGTMDFILAQANMVGDVLKQELDRRKIDQANAAKQAAAAAKLQPKPRTLGVRDTTKLAEQGGQLENLNRYNDTFSDDYAGYGRGGETLMSLTRRLPFVSGEQTENAAKWWQDYARYKNVVRNQLFGSALTESEKQAFEEADINPNMAPDVVKSNLARQQSAVRSALQKTARALTASGYSQEAIEGALGVTLDELNKPDEGVVKRLKPDAPVKVKSADEARELIRNGTLKSGDAFIDETGQPRTVK